MRYCIESRGKPNRPKSTRNTSPNWLCHRSPFSHSASKRIEWLISGSEITNRRRWFRVYIDWFGSSQCKGDIRCVRVCVKRDTDVTVTSSLILQSRPPNDCCQLNDKTVNIKIYYFGNIAMRHDLNLYACTCFFRCFWVPTIILILVWYEVIAVGTV